MTSYLRHAHLNGVLRPGLRRPRGPVRAAMGWLWALFWTGFGLAMGFSPEFRAGFLDLVRGIPQMVASAVDWLRSGGEI